ncbi:MAG: ABC transporter permease [Atopobiaceae bacterium]|nr:ABC transporter permease [Atopobiaceae bacterium]
MWNTFKYTTLSIVRERSIVIWVMLFPLILATLFNAMFKGIDENAHDLDPIPVAIVNKSEGGADKAFNTMVDALSEGDEAILAPMDAKTDEEARALLRDNKAIGVVTLDVDGWPSLELSAVTGTTGVSMGQVERTVLADVIDDFCRTREALEDIMRNDPQAAENPEVVLSLVRRDDYTSELKITHSQTREYVRYFYALLGFAAVMAANVSLTAVGAIQPNVSVLGARRAIGGTGRSRMLAGAIAASWLVSFLALVVAFAYIRFALGVEFGGREAACVLGIAVAALMATALGALVGALPYVPYAAKSGILTGITCLLSLFAGLYGTPALRLADQVARDAPWATVVNPVKQVSNLFYSLYVYTDLTPFFRTIGVLTIITAVLALAAALMMRRQSYASL